MEIRDQETILANRILSYSSEYGSSAYSVQNLVLHPKAVYPKYGDYSNATVLRYYGKFWSKVPSAAKSVGFQPNSYPTDYSSQDFIEVGFPTPLRLLSVRVYETFVPGCIVKIFAKTIGPDGRWFEVWRSTNCRPQKLPHKARIFEPNLTCSPYFPVDSVRLEFNIDLAVYYTELDAVELVGIPDISKKFVAKSHSQSESIMPDGRGDSEPEFAIDSVQKKINEMQLRDTSHLSAGIFGQLPAEINLLILNQLDLQSLSALSRTCRLLNRYCNDSEIYRSLSLRPYCLRVNDEALNSLIPKCSRLRELDFSWCGGDARVSSAAFSNFIDGINPKSLRVLRLASCPFLDDKCLSLIAQHCVCLNELDLSGCSDPVTENGYHSLSQLNQLQRLTLYRSSITQKSLVAILRNNGQLQHLNIGACNMVSDFDDVALIISDHCLQIISIDFWRARSLTSDGIFYLADKCKHLEELDLGWCNKVDSDTGCVTYLANKCKTLRKLFLTANRTLSDDDLYAMAKNCTKLQQLDILGTRSVTENAVGTVLKSCPNLEMFDVSFCNLVKRQTVHEWRGEYPNCAIQMSFQAEDNVN